MSEVNYVLDRLYLEVSKNDWGAIPKEENTIRTIDQPSDRGWATHLRAVGLQPTNQTSNWTSKAKNNYFGKAKNDCFGDAENDWTNTRMSTITSNIKQGLEPLGVLDQELKIWNRPGALSQPKRPDDQKVIWKINSKAIPDIIR